jgi:phosphatidylserine/phosphatidylglycerophosphate/cardiolipin synthase-like enzyme
VILEPAARRAAVLAMIRQARARLDLSLFRCNDPEVLDELGRAVRRGVDVNVLVTSRSKGRRKLQRLRDALDATGATLHAFSDPVVKYHAKYLVADDSTAIITTLNPTRKCFTRTWDAVLLTQDPAVVKGLLTLFKADAAGAPLPSRRPLSRRLIVGPERSRSEFRALICSAKHSIRILDHKLSDPDLVGLLRERRGDGIIVTVLGKQPMRGVEPHGKMMIIDEARAVLGSTALSTLSLDFRREVSVVVHDPALVKQLNVSYQELAAKAGVAATHLPGDRTA